MAETYDVICENERVGAARMEKQGLYCCFSCRCRLPEEGLYRIHVVCGGKREDLGICIPMDGAFGMDKKIPAKRLGEGALSFELVPKDWQPQAETVSEPAEQVFEEEILEPEPAQEHFIPVSEEAPFEQLDKLEHAYMEIRDDVPGIVIEPGMEV